jgi:hypothetical protein
MPNRRARDQREDLSLAVEFARHTLAVARWRAVRLGGRPHECPSDALRLALDRLIAAADPSTAPSPAATTQTDPDEQPGDEDSAAD